MVSYRDIPLSGISVIKDVWERNRKFHEEISTFFDYLYADLIFEDRMDGLRGFDENHIKVTLAEASGSSDLLGYCISTFEGNRGQPQTLHVIEEYRGSGIGKALMIRHLDWLSSNGCEDVTISVSYENTRTIDFYKSLGFWPNTLEMRLK